MIRRTVAIILVLSISFEVGIAIGSGYNGEEQRNGEVSPWPPTEHVEWDQYPCGGYTLCSPALEDTGANKGKYRCVTLPDGTIVMYPHLVRGASDEDKRRIN
jgi:hypothetical protein